MIKLKFDGDVDYFELDPVAYAPALGDTGMNAYRARLDAIRSTLTPAPVEGDRWSVPDRHERWVLEWNDRRLAVLDRDVDAIIRTHARDPKVAAWLQDTAKAFEEIGSGLSAGIGTITNRRESACPMRNTRWASSGL